MTMWGLEAIFNPGSRHVEDEKLRLQNTREEAGDSAGGKRIDLESGTVHLTVPKKSAAKKPRKAADAGKSAAAERAAARRAGVAKSAGKPSSRAVKSESSASSSAAELPDA
jgi:hypothetical protein